MRGLTLSALALGLLLCGGCRAIQTPDGAIWWSCSLKAQFDGFEAESHKADGSWWKLKFDKGASDPSEAIKAINELIRRIPAAGTIPAGAASTALPMGETPMPWAALQPALPMGEAPMPRLGAVQTALSANRARDRP